MKESDEMAIFDGYNVYEKLGVTPLINAAGTSTNIGGSNPSDRVMQAMLDANRNFVDMGDLLDKSGEYIAEQLGVEAAYPTSGGAAALVLSSAACIAGIDQTLIGELPETGIKKNKILIQKSHRNSFDRCFAIAGARVIEVGVNSSWTANELDNAIDEETAAVAYLNPFYYDVSNEPLQETVNVSRNRGIPVIIDASCSIYPLARFRDIAQMGDLVCFGGKYFNASHATGFLCGRKDLVEAAVAHGFIGLPNRSGKHGVGRPMKMDRNQIIGLVAALDEWFTMNHEDRFQKYEHNLLHIKDKLSGLSGVSSKLVFESLFTGVRLQIDINPKESLRSAEQIFTELLGGIPKIWVGFREYWHGEHDDDCIQIYANTLFEGEEVVIADRLCELLTP